MSPAMIGPEPVVARASNRGPTASACRGRLFMPKAILSDYCADIKWQRGGLTFCSRGYEAMPTMIMKDFYCNGD